MTIDYNLSEEQQKEVQRLKKDLQREMAQQHWTDYKNDAIDALCFLREMDVPRDLLLPIAKRLHTT